MNSLVEKIIVPAWLLIKDDTRLKRLFFLPGLLSIIVFSIILSYQVIYTYVKIFWEKAKALELILDFVHSGYFFEVAVTVGTLIVTYIFITPICEGALIYYINEKQHKERVSFSGAIGVGVFRFLSILEYNNIFSQFRFTTILNAYLFTLRLIGVEYIRHLSYTFLAILVFWMIINILFAYAKYEVVLRGVWVLSAIGASIKITTLSPKVTLKLYFLMFFLNIRVLLNFLIFLVFPISFFSALVFISSQFFLFITLFVIAILFLFFVFVMWYLSAVLEIFQTAIWYFAYLEWKKLVEEVESHTTGWGGDGHGH